MKILSINRIIRSLYETDKVYLTTYIDDGYELGFGKRGLYKGHSHYFFYDILFSPEKLIIKNENNIPSCFLAVVPPKTFMSDVEIGDFFFIKFCPTNDNFSLPEKTNIILNEGKIELYSNPTELNFRWFKTVDEKLSLNMVAEQNNLTITFNNNVKIKIIE